MTTYYRTIEIDGISIFYREAGDRDRPTLLLLHGFPASSFMFRDLIAMLADTFHVIAPDYPGFGHSDAPDPARFNYTFDRIAEIIEKFTARLGLSEYAIYMQDFGGPVGFRLAVSQPDQVLFLVAQNANAYEEGLPDAFWHLARDLWRDPSPENRERIREAGMSDEALRWNYIHGVGDVEKVSPDSWVLQSGLLARPGSKDIMVELLYDYRTNLELYPRWHEYFRSSQPPMLIVWGKNDVIFPAEGAYPYRRDLTTVDFNLLDTGHFALEEMGDRIAAHIKQFAGTLSLAGQPSVRRVH